MLLKSDIQSYDLPCLSDKVPHKPIRVTFRIRALDQYIVNLNKFKMYVRESIEISAETKKNFKGHFVTYIWKPPTGKEWN